MLLFDTILDYIAGILSTKNVIVLTGETGSGKTIKIPQLAYFLGLTNQKKILCTEPRRISVCNAAKEVSKRIGCRLGTIAGYSIRFEERINFQTKLKFVTEGLLLKEWLANPFLKTYSVLIIDEAHERSSYTDTILALVKNQINLSHDLKVVLMSATLDAEKFSKFLFNCPVLYIPGRCFSIRSFFLKSTSEAYISNIVKTIYYIMTVASKGDVLVFLNGKEEIDLVGHILYSVRKFFFSSLDYDIIPIFSELSTTDQITFLENFSNKRKIILATNIAEASITISGINFIVDTGLSKLSYFDLAWNQKKLALLPINPLNAKQRAGRIGRIHSGRCFHLYSKWSFRNELGTKTIPEIQRIDLCGTILFLKSLGLTHFLSFNWIDNPPKIMIIIGLKTLYLLGALNKRNQLTVLGRKMVEFPLRPMLSKSLILSEKFNCREEIIYLSCLLSIPFLNLSFKLLKKLKFKSEIFYSDHLIYCEIFREWKKNNYSREWCENYNYNFSDFSIAKNIEYQLQSLIRKIKTEKKVSLLKKIEQALLSGFFLNTAKLVKNGFYRSIFSKNQLILKICSSSNLNNFSSSATLILFDHLQFKTKIFMKIITVIPIEVMKEFSFNL